MIQTKSYKSVLEKIMELENLDVRLLKIVPSIKEFLDGLSDCPFKENSEERIAKFVMFQSDKVYLILKEIITEKQYRDTLTIIATKEFNLEELKLLEDPQNFLVHQLLHEIRHYKGLDFHSEMDDPQKEKDSDTWAFERLKWHNRVARRLEAPGPHTTGRTGPYPAVPDGSTE